MIKQSKINKNSSNTNLTLNRNPSKASLNTKPIVNSRLSPSPSNHAVTARQVGTTPMSKERSMSKNSKSTFKLFIGRKDPNISAKKQEIDSKSSQKENIHPNINASTIKNQKQKGRTLKQIRLAVSKPETNITKNSLRITPKQPQPKTHVKKIKFGQSSPEQSMLKYIPQEIVKIFSKVSLQDFVILRQTEEFQCSNEYLAIHKRLNCLFTIKKFNKNLVMEQQLLEQLIQSIRIHFYLSQNQIGINIQKLFMIFHDATSVYLILQPILAPSIKNQRNILINSNEQNIKKFDKILQTLSQLHQNNIIIRNLSLKFIKNEMGVLKITNIINAASFSHKKRRQSFLGSLTDAPHEVAIGSSYDSSYDMWSVGLMFYELIMNFCPFEGEHAMTLIKNLQFKLPISLSSELAWLLSSLLCEQNKRFTSVQCLKLALFSRQSHQNHMVSRDIYHFWSSQ